MSTRPLSMPRGILFDFGDTVMHTVSEDPMAGNARILELAENQNGLTAEQIQQCADEIEADVVRRKVEAMIEFGFQSFQRILFDTLGLSFRIEAAELEQEFWRAAIKCEPAEGIHEVLHTLARFGIEAGIVSNCVFRGKVLEDELAAHGLLGHFKFVISSIDYGYRKPHRRIFDVAVKKLRFATSDVWFVGDRIERDIVGARGAGLVPVWYNYGDKKHSEPNCMMVRTWDEFRKTIEAL